jgi:hypothetical protein
MRPLSSKNVNNQPGNSWVGILLIVIGAGFIGVTLQDGLPLGLFHNAYNTASFLLFAAVGVALVSWGMRALIFSRSFEQPEVEVSPRIQSGSEFRFRYARAARRPMTIRSIDAFFVYREKVSWGDGDSGRSHYLFDRLIERQTFPGRALGKGEKMALDCAFRAPSGEMGVRNPYMHHKGVELECQWVVRVRMQFDKSSEIWEDYQIEIAPRAETAVEVAGKAQEGLFDVLLLPSPVENTTSIREALKEIVPQLDQSGIPYAQHHVPNVIRERVGEQEAEALAKQLREAGGIVNIIATEATWQLAAEDKQAQPGEATNLSL